MNLVRPVVVLSFMLFISACDEEVKTNASFRCDNSTVLQQNTLNLVNAFRSQNRLCGVQTHMTVPPLSWNSQLASAAIVHARDMATNDFFDHTGSDGSDPSVRIQRQGYAPLIASGENLASGVETIVQAIQRLEASKEHCENLMSPNFTEIGAACAQNSDSEFGTYYVQNFGSR